MLNNKQSNSDTGTAMSADGIETSKKKTMNLSITEGSVWAIMWGAGESFVEPFAIMLGAGNVAMSLLRTLPIIFGAFAQMLGASITEIFRNRRAVTAITSIMHAFSYLFLFWIPFFFPSIAVPAAVTITTLMLICGNMGVPAWNSIMGDIVPEETRGRYFGRRTSIIMLMMVISTVIAGKVLSASVVHNKVWLGFGILFSIAMISRACSAIMIGYYYDPPFNPSREDYFSFWDFIRRTPRSNFAKFTFAITLMNGATTISAPFFSVYMIRDLHWTMDQFAITQAVMLLSQYVFLRWWGIICDRYGNRSVIAATSLLIPFLPMFWTFFPNYHFLLFVQVLGGALWSGFNLASANFMFDSVTPEKRHRAFGYFSVINGIFVLIGGSIIGAFLAENLSTEFKLSAFHFTFISSLPLVFIVSGLVRILIVVTFLPLFKEVRQIEHITSREILWRMVIGEPVIDQASHLFGIISSPFRNTERTEIPDQKPDISKKE